MSSRHALIIFIKNPILGKVKTRLAEEIGPQKALDVYEKLLGITRQVCDYAPYRKFLFYSDFIDEADQWSNDIYEKHLQTGKDLGEKMFNAFVKVLDDPSINRVCIIGSDCPKLSPELIEKAFLALETHRYVLGPATDGGYYLLGLSEIHKEVFQNKRWSTATVLRQTIDSLHNVRQTYYFLPTLSDIEIAQDLILLK
jgi:uncharacterized protein